jgi:hypothetical protein
MTGARAVTGATDTGARPMPSTRGHLDALIATGADGWVIISTVDRAGRWLPRSYRPDEIDDAAQSAAELDNAGLNVYVRSNLLKRPLAHEGERGRGADTGAAVALAVDLDVEGPGHTPRTQRAAVMGGVPRDPFFGLERIDERIECIEIQQR